MASIYYQGHASLRLTASDGQVIYIDPYAGDGYEPAADMVLITHHHFDHDDLSKIKKKDNTVIVEPQMLHPDIDTYLTRDFGNIRISAVEAYNHNHPKESCVGYIVAVDGKRIYFAGDTSITDMMKDLGELDLAFLPTDGRFNMNAATAKKAALLIGAKKTVPIHMNPHGLYDEKIAAQFTEDHFALVRPGETIVC